MRRNLSGNRDKELKEQDQEIKICSTCGDYEGRGSGCGRKVSVLAFNSNDQGSNHSEV